MPRKKALNLKRNTKPAPKRKRKKKKVWRTNIMPTNQECNRRGCRNTITWNKAWASDKGIYCSKSCAEKGLKR